MTHLLEKYGPEIAAELKAAITKLDLKVQGDGDFEVIATTDAVDRDGEIIKADGWELANYQQNPVILWAHDYKIPPVGAVTSIERMGNGLKVKGVFAKTDLGQELRKLYDDGMLRTVSVGFIPKERQGNTITRAELLEVSFVPVPANPQALTLRRMADFADMAVKAAKGPLADHIETVSEMTQEQRDAKWKLLCDVGSVYWAMSDLCWRPEASPEDAKALIREACEMMVAIVDGAESEKGAKIKAHLESNKERALAFAKAKIELIEKAGRVLSNKNRELVGTCIGSLKAALDPLSELYDATEPEGEKVAMPPSEKEMILSSARLVDKAVEHFIRQVKN